MACDPGEHREVELTGPDVLVEEVRGRHGVDPDRHADLPEHVLNQLRLLAGHRHGARNHERDLERSTVAPAHVAVDRPAGLVEQLPGPVRVVGAHLARVIW